MIPDPIAAAHFLNSHLANAGVEAQLIDPLTDPSWDVQIASHPESSFFHTSAWAKVLCRTYGHHPAYLQIVKEGELVALLPVMEVRSSLTPRRGVSLPFTDLCEPLLFNGGTFDLVCDRLREHGRTRKWKYFEIRGGAPADEVRSSVAFYGHRLDLRGGVEQVFSGFDSSARRAVRKGERSGLTVEVSRTEEAVQQFYRLHARTRRRHGVPPQPLSFFLSIYREIIESGSGFVVLAYRSAQPVAGAIFFEFCGRAIYKFGASDESLQALRGNNFVMSHGIRHLAENGAESLHFGRTSCSNEGLRRFKRSWGAAEGTCNYFKFDLDSGKWETARDNASGFHTALFSRLPLAVNRLAGSILYSHLD